MTRTFLSRAVAVTLLAALSTTAVTAQEQPADFAWANSTELSFVTAAGNATSSTLGLKSTLEGTGPVNEFKFEIGGIRASSTVTDRSAIGASSAPGDYVITETDREVKAAENYFALGRYDRNIGSNYFLFGGAGWERNTFAGFNHRVSLVAGFGDAWVDNDRTLFKTDIGGTYTIQKDVEPTPGRDEAFGGLRATVEFNRALTENTDFESMLVADENLQNTEDLRLDGMASIQVSMSRGLALKASYRVLFDNDPALISVPLRSAGGAAIGDVTVLSGKADTFFTVSLVIKL